MESLILVGIRTKEEGETETEEEVRNQDAPLAAA